MDEIKIRGLEVRACHGVHASEKVNGQSFLFDADLKVDFYAAAQKDDLNLTVSYSDVCNLLVKIAEGNVFNLIETLAYRCAFSVLDTFSAVKSVALTVFKPEAPIKHKFKNVGVTVFVERERAYLSLGSSLGNKREYLDTAIHKLDASDGIRIVKVSSYIPTAPYGGVAENEFLNCAAEIETYLSPRALLNEIHRIENECGRVRDKHWGDRTLDIDIIFYGKKVIFEDDLIIPHPEFFKRNFVLIPLKEIAPEFLCPINHKKLKNY